MRFQKTIVFVLLLSLWGCNNEGQNLKSSEVAMTVEVPGNKVINQAASIEVNTRFEIIEEQIETEISGIIENVFVQTGDTVEANAPLAKFDDQNLKTDIIRIKELLVNSKDDQIKSNELYAKKLISKDEYNKVITKYNQLRITLKDSQEKQQKATIYAPKDGIIKTIRIGANLTVVGNQPAFILIRLDSMDVDFVFKNTEEQKLKVGDNLILKEVADFKNILHGRVTSITSSNESDSEVHNVAVRVKRNEVIRD